MKKIGNKNLINDLVKFMSIFMFVGIFLLLMFVDTKVEYTYSNGIKQRNYIYFGIIFLFVAIVTMGRIVFLKMTSKNKKTKKLSPILEKILEKDIILWFLFFLLFIVQIIVEAKIYFETSWDAEHIINTAIGYAKTGIFENNTYYDIYPYFSVYPNNLFLAEIFAILGKMVLFFGYDGIYHVLVIIDIILVDLAGMIMVKTIGNLTENKLTKFIGAIVYILFIGLSPWFMVPYSDTYSLIFTISVLYNYTKKEKSWYNYLFIGAFSYFGYLIKPTAIIVFIAIAIIEIGKILFQLKEKHKFILKAYLQKGIFLVLGILVVFGFKFALDHVIGYKVEEKYSFSYYHYLMMGINQDTTGCFNSGDVTNSLAIDGYEERIKENKQTLKERIKAFTFKNFCDFYTKKILVNYNDGTFAWGREGWFYKTLKEQESDLSKELKSFYYNDGDNFAKFVSIMQTIWIFILIFMIVEAIFVKMDDKKAVIFLSLIGLTLFTLLFEARARYLYLYSTYYIILAVIGVEVWFQSVNKLLLKNSLNKIKNKTKNS